MYKNESNIPNANKACFGFTRGACTVSFTMFVGRTRPGAKSESHAALQSFGDPPVLLIQWADQVTPGLGPYAGYHKGAQSRFCRSSLIGFIMCRPPPLHPSFQICLDCRRRRLLSGELAACRCSSASNDVYGVESTVAHV